MTTHPTKHKIMATEAELHYNRIYTAIQLIPHGKVTTYGYIAKLIGAPRNARQVGYALRNLPNDSRSRRNRSTTDDHDDSDSGPTFDHTTVPWWRVIGSGGHIVTREDRTARDRQVDMLRQEGVHTIEGTYRVSMGTYGWDMTERAEDRIMDRLINGTESDDGGDEPDSEDEPSA